MGDYGLKISKAGFDVLTCAVKDQIFNSSYNNFKIVAEGLIALSVASGDVTKSTDITHGLGYTPGFMAFAQLSGDANVSYLLNSFDLFSGIGEGFTGFADGTKVRLTVDGTGSAYTAQIYYYIIADPSL